MAVPGCSTGLESWGLTCPASKVQGKGQAWGGVCHVHGLKFRCGGITQDHEVQIVPISSHDP